MIATHTPSTRRDRRYALRPGSSTFEFTDPRPPAERVEVSLVLISTAGLELRIERGVAAPPKGCILDGVTVRIGNCVLEGNALVRSNRASDDGTHVVGCLFYPATRAQEELLMVLLAGIDAAQPTGDLPR